MTTTTANNVIERAMVKAKVISPGESIPASKLNQVFEELNDMLERWALEKLTVYANTLEEFTLIVGQAEYTYGTDGDFDSEAPIRILDDTQVTSGTTDYPVRLKTLNVYRNLAIKAAQSRPKIMAYNPEFPKQKVFLWPTPDYAYTLKVKAWKILTRFSDKTTEVDLPLGYRGGIVNNLAVEIAPNFGKTPDPTLVAIAGQFKKAIKNANTTPVGSRRSELAAVVGKTRDPYFNSGPFI